MGNFYTFEALFGFFFTRLLGAQLCSGASGREDRLLPIGVSLRVHRNFAYIVYRPPGGLFSVDFLLFVISLMTVSVSVGPVRISTHSLRVDETSSNYIYISNDGVFPGQASHPSFVKNVYSVVGIPACREWGLNT